MSEQDRLREEIRQCFTDTEMQHDVEMTLFDTDITIDNLQALIAREVRLGKIEELKTILFGAYGTDDISGRIKELEDE